MVPAWSSAVDGPERMRSCLCTRCIPLTPASLNPLSRPGLLPWVQDATAMVALARKAGRLSLHVYRKAIEACIDEGETQVRHMATTGSLVGL
jgi:hypothetical protein